MIQAMDQLADHKNIKFLIAGHGNKMPSVRQVAERLPNVRICDFLTGAAFEHAVAASSCGIVSLEKGLTGMCAPVNIIAICRAVCQFWLSRNKAPTYQRKLCVLKSGYVQMWEMVCSSPRISCNYIRTRNYAKKCQTMKRDYTRKSMQRASV